MSEAGATAPGAAEGANGNGAAGTAEAALGQPGPAPAIDLEGLEIPPELTPYMERYVREKVDPALTKRLMEAADLSKRYEPLSGVEGLSDIDPSHLKELVDFYGVASDPEQFEGWYTERARQLGKDDPDALEKWWADLGNEFGFLEDDGGELGGGEPDPVADLRSLVEKQAEEIEGLKQSTSQREQQERVDARQEKLNAQMTALDFGDLEGEQLEDAQRYVIRLARTYDGPDDNPDEAIPNAFADWQRQTGRAEAGLIEQKLGQPNPALNGGRTANQTEEITTANAKELALARMKASVGSTP